MSVTMTKRTNTIYCVPGIFVDLPGSRPPVVSGWTFSFEPLKEMHTTYRLEDGLSISQTEYKTLRSLAKKYGTYIKLLERDIAL